MAIENGQMSLWNRKTWARMAQPKAKIVNPPHLISPPPTPSLTSQTPLFRSLDSNFGEKCSISCLSSSPKISLVDQSHLMIITLAFDIHQFHHNPDQDQEQLTLYWGCDISRNSVDHNLSSKSEPHWAHWGSIKSRSCRFQCADSLPLLFVHLSNLVREELIMWTLHLPLLLLILRGWVVVQGVDNVNLPPALLTFDFERMSCCLRSWWCEPCTCP